MPKIREYPEASQANSDDALILDSEEGTKYIRASNLLGPLALSSTVDRVTASGSVAHFDDGADNAPMKDVLVHIEPVQAGSGDPSPDNVRPITGWTGAKVTRTGKNLWTFNDSYSSSGYIWLLDHVPFILYPGTYTFSAVPNIEADSIVLFGHHEDGTRTEIGRLIASTTRSSATATVSKPIVSLSLVANTSGTISNIQLELGSTATEYEPYSGETYDITFPSEAGTVYGGTLDVTKGELVVNKAMVTVDSTMLIARQNGQTNYYFNLVLPDVNRTAVVESGTICNILKSGNFSGNPGIWRGDMDACCIRGGGMSFYTDVTKGMESANALQWLVDNRATVVYPIATPITYYLTAQEITSLLGANHIWSDTGDTTVKYRIAANETN